MNNWYQQLKSKEGEAVAREKMREMRSKVKNIPGGAFRDPEFAKQMSQKGVEARVKKQKELKERQALEGANSSQG